MLVIFIHGPVAAGKHTVGTELSRRTGMPLFHNHLAVDLAGALFKFGSEGFVRLRARLWRAAFAEAAAAGRSFIFTFNPEATVDPALIDELVGIVESAGGRMCFVELTCSRDAILARLGNASRANYGKLVDRDLYQQIERDGGFRFPPIPPAIVTIDTERVRPEEAATLIEGALIRAGDGA